MNLYLKGKNTLTDKKRDKDNPDQEVDFSIPNILSKYISVKEGIKNIIENK